ncbi:Vacuolar protein sorting-associated protein 41 [Cichlidogyrus casuarinus]|uniref:Vacuolar protein sorting-associated protein 41 n=1 Tax=Cichlidogyrus casuarinus TaxID=1844966 RepID=A0ABD2PVV5_9PLAT
MISKGMISKNKFDELYKSNDPIQSIKWRNDLVLWADKRNVRVFDMKEKTSVAYLSFEPCSQRCHLKWLSNSLFAVGWKNLVTLCQVSDPVRKVSTVENMSSRQSVTSSTSIDMRSFRHRPSIVGSLKVLASSPVPSLLDSYNKIIKVVHKFQLEPNEIICGLTQHFDNLLLMLFPETTKSDEVAQPNILLAEVGDLLSDPTKPLNHSFYPNGYHIISKEELILRTADSSMPYFSNFYAIETVPYENTHYIVSPKDIACAERPTVADRVKWRLSQGFSRQAIELAQENKKDLLASRNENWPQLIKTLLDEGNASIAAELCPIVLKNQAEWEEEIHEFLALNQLKAIAHFVPLDTRSEAIHLSPTTYELILTHLMREDPAFFYNLVSTWPNDQDRLFSHQAIISAVNSFLENDQHIAMVTNLDQLSAEAKSLFCTLAILYEQSGNPEKSIDLLLRLKKSQVFQMLNRHIHSPNHDTRASVLKVISSQVEQLMDLNIDNASKFLVEQMDHLPIEKMIEQLEHRSFYLYHYLDRVYHKRPQAVAGNFSKLLKLYAKHDRKRLWELLRSSDNYPLNEALDLCKSNRFIQEWAYLLTRIGKKKDALELLMMHGGDELEKNPDGSERSEEQRQKIAAHTSIAYLREQDEQFAAQSGTKEGKQEAGPINDLWQIVLNFAVDKPAFICALLEQAGLEGFDPSNLVRHIKPGTKIPGVQQAVTKLMNDYYVQIELRESCNKVLLDGLQQVTDKMLQQYNQPILVLQESTVTKNHNHILVIDDTNCHFCGENTLLPAAESRGELFTFKCKHINHADCSIRHSATFNLNQPECCFKLSATASF